MKKKKRFRYLSKNQKLVISNQINVDHFLKRVINFCSKHLIYKKNVI